MAELTMKGKPVDRRGFLRGSALFAAAVGLSVAAPALAQDQEQKNPAVPEDDETPQPPAGDQAKQEPPAGGSGAPAAKEDPNKLVDVNGVEYRVCERCGGNMYKEGNTWTCEQCGLSYTE